MKRLTLILLFLIPFLAHAQLIPPAGKQWNSKEVFNKVNDSTVYFVDTVLVTKREAMLTSPGDIASISAYFEDEPGLPDLFRAYMEHGVIALTTKEYAISIYRVALSSISCDYAFLTSNHPANRDSLLYIIDGDTLKPNVESKLLHMNFSEIGQMEVLFPAEAEKVYGDKAKLGVVIISSRQELRT